MTITLLTLLAIAGAAACVLGLPAIARRADRPTGPVVRQAWALVAQPIQTVADLLGALRHRLDAWWTKGLETVLPKGWAPARFIGAVVAALVWGIALVGDLLLFSDIVKQLHFEQGQVLPLTLITVAVTSAAGLLVTDALGLTHIFPIDLDRRGRTAVAAGAGVVLVALLGMQGWMGGARAEAVRSHEIADARSASALAPSLRDAGFGDVANKQDQTETRAIAAADARYKTNKVFSSIVPVLAGLAEAATSWAIVTLVLQAVLAVIGVGRLAVAALQLLVSAASLALDRLFTIHKHINGDADDEDDDEDEEKEDTPVSSPARALPAASSDGLAAHGDGGVDLTGSTDVPWTTDDANDLNGQDGRDDDARWSAFSL
jgi:hypothetical protein